MYWCGHHCQPPSGKCYLSASRRRRERASRAMPPPARAIASVPAAASISGAATGPGDGDGPGDGPGAGAGVVDPQDGPMIPAMHQAWALAIGAAISAAAISLFMGSLHCRSGHFYFQVVSDYVASASVATRQCSLPLTRDYGPRPACTREYFYLMATAKHDGEVANRKCTFVIALSVMCLFPKPFCGNPLLSSQHRRTSM